MYNKSQRQSGKVKFVECTRFQKIPTEDGVCVFLYPQRAPFFQSQKATTSNYFTNTGRIERWHPLRSSCPYSAVFYTISANLTTCLEGHVLQEVSCSVILLVFISAPGINPQPNLNEITEWFGRSPAAGETVQALVTLTALTEDPTAVPSTKLGRSSSGLRRHLNSHVPHTDTFLKIIQ